MAMANNSKIFNGLWRIEWSRDRQRHVSLNSQGHDPNTLKAQYFENSWRCCWATIAKY